VPTSKEQFKMLQHATEPSTSTARQRPGVAESAKTRASASVSRRKAQRRGGRGFQTTTAVLFGTTAMSRR
jgi:hypothetical protein